MALLFVHGGDAVARRVMADEGRGYWSQALPLVLEKHGFLDLEEAGPEALADEERLAGADAVLVARLPAHAWTDEALAAITDERVNAVVEGPLPEALDLLLETGAETAAENTGSVLPVDQELRGFVAAYGAPLGGQLTLPTVTPVDRPPELEWRELEGVPITEPCAEAWGARAWDVALWSPRRGEVLAHWVGRPSGARHPAILRAGGLVACCFGLFAFLGQRHTVEPFGPREWRACERSVGVEAILLALIDAAHRRKGRVRARVAPWPHPWRWVRTVRHDVTAALPHDRIGDLLQSHGDTGSRATFYCTPGIADTAELAARLGEAGHELALQAEKLWGAQDDERAALEHLARTTVRGAAARAGADCFRHQGAPNVLWAERAGLEYTETTGRSHLHPHRFPMLRADGTIRPLEVICLPQHESLAALAASNDRLAAGARERDAIGGVWALQAAPDPNGATRSLAETPAGGRLDMTANELASWWRRTHVADAVALRRIDASRFQVSSREPLAGLVLELLRPDGRRIERPLDTGPEPLVVDGMEEAPGDPDRGWQDIEGTYMRALRRSAAAGDVRSSPEEIDAAVQRGLTAARHAAAVLDVHPPPREDGETALVWVGDGFAAGAAQLTTTLDRCTATVVDWDATRIKAAREAIETVGLSGRLLVTAARSSRLALVGDGDADVVVVTSSQPGRGAAGTLRHAARALRQGGRLLVTDGEIGMAGRAVLRREGVDAIERVPVGDGRFVCVATRTRPASGARVASTPRPRPDRRPDLPISGWARASDAYAEELAAYYAARNRDPGAAATRITIETNTSLVPQRGDVLLDCLDQLVGLPSIEGLRVLELGCGFGALATYLQVRGRPRELVAVDLDDAFLAVARTCAERLGLGDVLAFEKGDMRDLGPIAEEPFDVVLVNNAFIYLTSKAEMRQAIREFGRALGPGGALLFYHANRWRLREPFTGDPLVHLMPASVAAAVGRLTGWRGNHGRVRLVGPGELARLLRQEGFENGGTRTFSGKARREGRLTRAFGTFYAHGATKLAT